MDIEQEFKNKRDAILSEMTYAEQNNILLQAVLDQLITLNEQKKTANEQQKEFQKQWKMKNITWFMGGISVPLVSFAIALYTGVIDLNQDWPVIVQRVGQLLGGF